MFATLPFQRKIKSFEYDEENGILTIVFSSRITKKYFDVPVALYEDLTNAADPTIFYLEKIDGQYRVQ